jgi:hypothetical protein
MSPGLEEAMPLSRGALQCVRVLRFPEIFAQSLSGGMR